MSSNSTSTSAQLASRERYSAVNTSTTPLINNDAKSNTSNQAQRQQQQQPGSDYWTSPNTPVENASQPSAMSSTTSSRSPASSARGGTSIDSLKRPLVADPRRSSIERAMDKAKNKLGRSPSGTEALPNNELDYERQRAKAVEKQQRKEEYERLGLSEKTKYGMPGGVSFNG